MSNGIIVTCIFFPRVDQYNENDDFVVGNPCENCMSTRPTCSAFFIGLCGIDSKDIFLSVYLFYEL